MNLMEDLANLPEKSTGGTKPCNLGRALESMSAEERTAVIAAVNDLRYSNGAISTVLRKNGIEVGESTVRNHRKGNCQWCSRRNYGFQAVV
jgi:hypothetical protein